MVPKTEGCGDELLSRIIVAGRAKVRAATCKNNTKEMPSQTAAPEAGSGAFDVDGKSAIYGARKYAAGKRIKEPRKQRMRPKRALAHGYRRNCRATPIKPMMAMAKPIVGGGKASPEANLNALRGAVS